MQHIRDQTPDRRIGAIPIDGNRKATHTLSPPRILRTSVSR
jgi:hypothetical protein